MANERARALRNSMAESEWLLWSVLRKRQLSGCRFRRQHPMGPYVVDFICLEKGLIIEVDGGHHSDPDQIRHDEVRTRWLEERGFQVMRVWNTEVFDNLDGVGAS
ncbi:MAG: endonuclease domain-containing protein, partial [Hyphomicrobiaceae bacterium]